MGDHRIVVGVDGTDGGRRALGWALHEAAARGSAVQAVTAWRWDTAEPTESVENARQAAQRTLKDEIAAEIAAVPATAQVPVAAEVVEGRAADVLCRVARDADMLVLGSHGHDRVYHTVLGSTAQECVEAAECPVVVIPSAWRSRTRSAAPALVRR
ncbi:MAG TPA: universal stress protein [Micromonosporaceae bacterium]|jgi:nucleotide-binding universal stress UspA family protein